MRITPLESWISQKIANGSEPLSREKIAAYQLMKLRDTLRRAKERSPFYARRLAGFDENAISGLEDLSRLPFTTPDHVRRDDSGFLCVSQSEVSRVVTLQTSGTTGEPKRLYFSADDQELTVDFMHRGMSTFVGPGDRVLIMLPGGRPGGVAALLAAALGRLGAVGLAHGPVSDLSSTLELVAREKITSLVGAPVEILSLARRAGAGAAPRSVLLTTDHVPEAITAELRRLWGCDVYNHYGMTEMGLGGGVECGAHHGYHLREADLYFEIVDPKTGAPAGEGERGEIVFTTLTRRAMPLIRYRTGDLSRFLPEPCPCSTVLKTLERVRDRIEGNLALGASGTLGMADLDEALFPLSGLLDFSASILREKERDRLNIEIHAMEGCVEQAVRQARTAVEAIPAVRSALAEDALFLSVYPRREGGTGPITTGKRRIGDRGRETPRL